MNIGNIPIIYRSDDTIYHYTNTKTALLHILPSMKIRLTPRGNSIDPIESQNLFISYSGGVGRSDIREIQGKIGGKALRLTEVVKQVSFCQNSVKNEEVGIKIHQDWEHYGFVKPRMWDQYGDKYDGVCLAFSKSKLLTGIDKKFKNGELDYLTYKEMNRKHQSINYDEILKQGELEYTRLYLNWVKQRMFYKHKDYAGEDEFRICSFSENEYEFLDITNSLIGIIITLRGVNQHLIRTFRNMISDNVLVNVLSFHNAGIGFDSALKHVEGLDRHNEFLKEYHNKK